MTLPQALAFSVLFCTLALFMIGKWRYDGVALVALLASVATGIVDSQDAYFGFGHPAVVTVGAVLVVSRGLLNSGLVDVLARWLTRVGKNPTVQVAALTLLVAVCSGFMNNVGALALFLPATLRMARAGKQPASLLLMPLAFGSLLGGMTTLIGTPPNIVIAAFRAQTGALTFRMFDFSLVGVGVAAAGIVFIALVGWRLLPRRTGQLSPEELFQINDYISEVRVPESSKIVGKPLGQLENISESDCIIVGLVRGERRIAAPSRFEITEPGDVLIVEADSDSLKALIDAAGLELEGTKKDSEEKLKSDEVSVVEAVVMPDSSMEGNTAWTLGLRWRYGLNLLGVARQGTRLKDRLKSVQFQAGDVLLLQGSTESLQQALPALGCLPLAERGLRLGQRRRILLALSIFALALGASATGFAAVQISFVGAALAMVLMGLLSLREAYQSIDWSVIVLLGAMIPVGQALETTGAAALIAESILSFSQDMPGAFAVAVVLIGTMFLSDVVNNAAAAVLMAPIAISIAEGLGVSADPFLMGVAIGASSAFLTPIGHQSNTLVMGPAGYKFGDYWRMGLPLEVIVVGVSLPLILWFWPL